MVEILIQVIAGITIILLSGSVGLLVRNNFFRQIRVLPRGSGKADKRSYSHLNGDWHLYFVTRGASTKDEPFWVHGHTNIQVRRNNQVTGKTHIFDHPVSDLDYRLQGEIRFGRMILTDTCLQDETEYATLLFTNLRSSNVLIGIWTGFDNDVHAIAAPSVMSRDELSRDQLNEMIRKSTMSLVQCGPDYLLYEPSKSKE